MKKCMILCLLFFIFQSGFTQNFNVDYLHGDSRVDALTIIDSNVWAGGFLGLTRINTNNHSDKELIVNHFVNFSHQVFSVVYTAHDNLGNLFVSDGRNLYSYHAGSLSLLRSFLSVNDFFIDENNVKWVINAGFEIVRINVNGSEISYTTANSTLPAYNYNSIFVKNNKIYLGSSGGLVVFDGITSQVTDTGNSSLPYNNVSAVVIDSSDNLWFACNTFGSWPDYDNDFTLIRIAGTTWTIYNKLNSGLPKTDIKKSVALGNTIYLCTLNGLVKFDGLNWKIYDKAQNNLLDDRVTSVGFKGQDLWIGTLSGISVMTPDSTINIKTANTTLSGGCQSPIVQDLTGNIWIGTDGPSGALSKFNGQNWKVVVPGTQSNFSSINCLAVDKNNVVWAANYTVNGGLYRVENDSVTYFTPNNSPVPGFVVNVIVDKFNNKWISSNSTLFKYNDTTWQVYTSADFQYLQTLRTLAADKDGNIWIGIGQKGMVRFDGTTWTHFDDAFFGNTYSQVNKIIIDTNNNLWIDYCHGTIDPKLCKYDGTTLTWYDQNIGLPDKGTYGHGLLGVGKNGDIWYSCDSGVARYDWLSWRYYNHNTTRLLSEEAWGFYIDNNNYKWISAGVYIARFNEDSLYIGITPISNPNNIYTVYPNPSSGIVHLKSLVSSHKEVTIRVSDMKGSVLLNRQYNNDTDIEIDLSEYHHGIYLLQLIGDGFVEMHKIIRM